MVDTEMENIGENHEIAMTSAATLTQMWSKVVFFNLPLSQKQLQSLKIATMK
jgi:hypothetical protein